MQLLKNEENIVREAIDGDEYAFRQLFQAYQDPIYRFIYRLLGDKEESADAMQTVFFKAYKKLSLLKDPRFFSSWLFSIAKNESISLVRKLKRKREESLNATALQIATTSNLPHDKVIGIELETLFQKALAELPVKYRAAFILGVLEKRPYEDVAEILGCTTGTIKSLVFRARSILGKKLECIYNS